MPVDHQALKRGAKGALEVPRARSSSQLRHGGAAVPNEQLSQEAADASSESSVKVTLAFKLNELLDENGLNQSAAAQLLGMPQPKVSAIRNYKLRGISLQRLMEALQALNQQVEIIVKPSRKESGGSIRVAV